jgi:hypothetical protein
MTSISGLPFERNTMTAVEVAELDALRKFWREHHGKKDGKVEEKHPLDVEEASAAINLLHSHASESASVYQSTAAKEYADAALAIAQTVVTMGKV